MGHASPGNDPRPGAIFVLIIGIDEVGASAFFLHYANGAGDTHRKTLKLQYCCKTKTDELRTLRGAVNDARAVEKYLLNLDVPPSNYSRIRPRPVPLSCPRSKPIFWITKTYPTVEERA
jgi:hypothetical protein